jgi:hypothetical protein
LDRSARFILPITSDGEDETRPPSINARGAIAAMDAADAEVYVARAEVGFPPRWRRRCESLQTARDPAAF